MQGLNLLQIAYRVFLPTYINTHNSSQYDLPYYPSRVQVDRGRICGHLIIWAGAVRPKTTKTNKKLMGDRPTEGLEDGPKKLGVHVQLLHDSKCKKVWKFLALAPPYL